MTSETNGKSSKHKKCFVIAPIGDENTTIRRKSDGLLNSVIKPALANTFDSIVGPLDLLKAGSITDHVIDLLLSSELVIANLTSLNPNVMYELAVRHAARKPVIIMAEIGTIIPFDIYSERTIFYHDDLHAVREIQSKLLSAVTSSMEDDDIDNPIYRVANKPIIVAEHKSFQEYMVNAISAIQSQITSSIQSPTSSTLITPGTIRQYTVEVFEGVSILTILENISDLIGIVKVRYNKEGFGIFTITIYYDEFANWHQIESYIKNYSSINKIGSIPEDQARWKAGGIYTHSQNP